MTSLERPVKVGVVVPIYNSEKHLRECLLSIKNQSYGNFSVFLINDGSTDNSEEILKEFVEDDHRFILINKKNGGVSSARNLALSTIEKDQTIDAICFIDSDDIALPHFIENFVNSSKNNGADYVICGYTPFNKKGPVESPCNVAEEIVFDHNTAPQHEFAIGIWKNAKSPTFSAFLSNRYYSSKSIFGLRFNESLKRAEDTDFLFQALHRVKKGVAISSSQYLYRIRASSLSRANSNTIDILESSIHIFLKNQSLPIDCKVKWRNSLLKSWWHQVCDSVTSKRYPDNREHLSNLLTEIQSVDLGAPVPFKTRAKIFLFKLGNPLLSSIVSLRTNKRARSLDAHQEAFD